MRKLIYSFYKRFKSLAFVSTAAYFAYIVIKPLFMRKDKNYIYNKGTGKGVKIAFICDEFTWKSFKDECDSIWLTPFDWKKKLECFKPDIFFCESAWTGIDKEKALWRGRIYKNSKVLFNNRRTLFRIIGYCEKNGIKTVFWNKEDPFYFDNEYNNFSDTARRFEYVFTTSDRCIEKYRALGCKNVRLLMFGFSEKIFGPEDFKLKQNKAVFAGSWFGEYKKRCRDMTEIFDMVLEKGIELEIYDRNYGTKDKLRQFPKKYEKYIRPSIPFEKIADIYKNAKYAINVNTIQNSQTMFARRVFEIMACNTCVISNESVGMEKMFGKNVWFYNKSFDFENIEKICAENVEYVFKNHTNAKRLSQLYESTGICK